MLKRAGRMSRLNGGASAPRLSREAGGGRRSALPRTAGAIAILAAAWAATASLAQDFRFSGFEVTGNQRVGDAAVLNFGGLVPGASLSAAELNDAVQRIRETGLFETVEVTPRGGTLVIEVTEYPTIGRIAFEGNTRLGEDDLAPVVRSQTSRAYSPTQAEEDVAAIAALYAERGRINAVVTPRIIRRPENRVDLVFEIAEGGVTEIERISFVGNRSFGDRRLRGVLRTKQAGALRALLTNDTFVADRIAFDRQVLTDFYRSRGYADFSVQNVDVALTRARDAYLLTFNVQEGQRFRFGEVSVTSEIPGLDPAPFREAVRLRPGAVYSPVTIETDIARLERLALQLGADFLRIEPRITRNDRDLTLDVAYALVQGPRIFVERIDIEGNATTLDRVIRNQFRVVEGDPFNPRAIRESAERIRALGFFADAQVNAREGSAPDQVVVDVDVVEQPTGSLSFGANYSSESGFGLIASFGERNFLGRGQSIDLSLSTAEANRVFSLSFAEPQFLGRDLRFGIATTYRATNRENALYDTDTFRFSPTIAFPISESGRLSLSYAAEYTNIDNVSPAASTIIKDEAAQGGVWSNALGYSYSYDTRRSGLDPTTGVLLRFGQEFGVGDSAFIETTALASAETRVIAEEVTLRATVEGGMLSFANDDSRVTDRFFLGSRLMRGFEPGGIGPRDADTDDALGGNYYAVARLETEFPIGLPEEYGITGGAFIDYGSVWDVGREGAEILYDDFTPRAVAGLAIFWTTPIGPLRFNFTEALQAEEFDRPKTFDVTISTSF